MALQESEARFRQLAETVKEGFFVFDTDTAQYSYLTATPLSSLNPGRRFGWQLGSGAGRQGSSGAGAWHSPREAGEHF
jgi:hypothetical protein